MTSKCRAFIGFAIRSKRITAIVFDAHKRDVEALLSGLAWIASHGNSDDAASNDELTEKAATRKLFLTCGNSSRWALHVLARCKVRARPVSTLTLEPWNSYDNGHSMIEVYREDLKRWVLYDLDSNACFVHGKELLSLVEMVERSAAGAYEIKFLAGDAPLDVSNFKSKTNAYDWAFSSERTCTESGLRNWYKRALQVPLIGNCFFLPTPNDADRARVEHYAGATYAYLTKKEFLKKFY